jgi:putative heme iron utilization protein
MGTQPAAVEARRLIRGASAATLATQAEGQPFASLVTPAAAPDLSVLLWLSTLSEHTRQLAREPRCALLFAGAQEGPNPQTAPRVTVTGVAERLEPGAAEEPALKARWLARHPYAALYAGFGDFALWRIRPAAALLVGGFARATRLRQAELCPDPTAVAAVAEAEPEILAHVNADHPDALAAIARGLLGAATEPDRRWRMVAVDVDGCDLAPEPAAEKEERPVLRLAFPAPVADAAGVRSALVATAREGRARLAGAG